MTIICVTNTATDLKPCTYPHSHLETCDGFEETWTERGLVATGRACPGCEPRKAHRGFVCRRCYESIVAALAAAPRFLTDMAGVETAITRDASASRGSSLGYVPMKSLYLALDEIRRYLSLSPGDADKWTSTPDGSATAVRFARATEAAARAHPRHEEPHKLIRTRCPDCAGQSLVWHPAPYPGAPIIVKCRDPKCGREIAEDKLDEVTYIESLGPSKVRVA